MKTYGKIMLMKLMVGDKVLHEGTTTADIKADTLIRNVYTGEEKSVTLINYNEYFMLTEAKTEDGELHHIMTTYASNIPHHWVTIDGKSWEVLDNEI